MSSRVQIHNGCACFWPFLHPGGGGQAAVLLVSSRIYNRNPSIRPTFSRFQLSGQSFDNPKEKDSRFVLHNFVDFESR